MCCRKTVGLGVEPCRKSFLNEHSSKFFNAEIEELTYYLTKKKKHWKPGQKFHET